VFTANVVAMEMFGNSWSILPLLMSSLYCDVHTEDGRLMFIFSLIMMLMKTRLWRITYFWLAC